MLICLVLLVPKHCFAESVRPKSAIAYKSVTLVDGSIQLEDMRRLLLCLLCPAVSFANEIHEPVTAYTARRIGDTISFVGGNQVEGTPGISSLLFVKEGTSDRTVAEFDIRNVSTAESAVLELQLRNIDRPISESLAVYSFKGNGLANVADYHRLDNLIAMFSDDGSNAVHQRTLYSIDVTATYNGFVSTESDHLGFVVKATGNSARFDLPPPVLHVNVPEPNKFSLLQAFLVLMAIQSVSVGQSSVGTVHK